MNFSDPKEILSQFHVDPGMTVADFGAGAGHFTFPLAQKVGTSGKVYAVEIQREMLDRLRSDMSTMQGINNVQFVWGDIDEDHGSTLQDKSLDRVVIINTLFQLEKKENTAKEIFRVLKDNGKVLVMDWSDSHGHLGPHPESVFNEEKTTQLFEKVGFTHDSDIITGQHHYAVVFRKK